MDNLNGTYTGEVIFPSAGQYIVNVFLEGEAAQHSPFMVVAE